MLRTEKELEALLSLAMRPDAWQPPIVKTVATESKGITDLVGAIAGAAMVMLMPPYHGVTIRADDMTIDFSGSAPQVRGAINCVYPFTLSTALACVRSIVDRRRLMIRIK